MPCRAARPGHRRARISLPSRAQTHCTSMTDDIPSLRRILATGKVIAVVGLSADWFRPSYFAAKYMLEHGYAIVPVNPRYSEILGQKCYPSLKEAAEKCGMKIDIADCFRRSEDIMPIC